jgi:FkbM family methyltransferase
MATERTNWNPPMLRRLVDQRLWGDAPLFLVDVGASGGIEGQWRLFGDALRAVAFEPLVSEVERLNRVEQNPDVVYEAAFVGCRDYDRLFPADLRNDRIRSRSNDSFQRVSATRAADLMRMNYVEEVFNGGAPAVYSDRRVVLDDYFTPDQYGDVDFIKIDTDGHDIEVLLGAQQMMKAGGVLGFSIESQLHGATHDSANTFANIDRLMRGHGFTLFDLEVYRYTRSTLPGPFVYDIPAQTHAGQTLWGEAVYFRDFGDETYQQKWDCLITRERVLKLAALFELFGLGDCAAELLMARGGFLDPAMRTALLDALVPTVAGQTGVSHADHLASFTKDPQSLYPSRRKVA